MITISCFAFFKSTQVRWEIASIDMPGHIPFSAALAPSPMDPGIQSLRAVLGDLEIYRLKVPPLVGRCAAGCVRDEYRQTAQMVGGGKGVVMIR